MPGNVFIPNYNQGRLAIYSCCDNYDGDKTETPILNMTPPRILLQIFFIMPFKKYSSAM